MPVNRTDRSLRAFAPGPEDQKTKPRYYDDTYPGHDELTSSRNIETGEFLLLFFTPAVFFLTGCTLFCHCLFSDNLYQYPLISSSVKFSVEDPLPRSEIELAVCHCHYYFPAHYLAFVVGIPVVFTGSVVSVQR